MSKVSVIVPIYNVKRYLQAALESLYRQSYTDLEILLVDDCSTDGSDEILRSFVQRDHRAKLLRQDRNRGYGAACNKAMDVATGDYIHIFEPDDVLKKEFYARMVEKITNDDVDFVRCNYIAIDENGKKIKKSRSLICETKKILNVRSDPRFVHVRICVWSLLIRRSMIVDKKIRLHESPGASFQDIALYYQLLCSAKNFSLMDEWLYEYRQHGEQSIRSRNKSLAIFGEYQFCLEHYISSIPQSEKLWSKGLLDAMMIEKFVRHGLHCGLERMEDFYNELIKNISSMNLTEMNHFFSDAKLSRSLYLALTKVKHLKYRDFCAQKSSIGWMLIGRCSRAERLIKKCLCHS